VGRTKTKGDQRRGCDVGVGKRQGGRGDWVDANTGIRKGGRLCGGTRAEQGRELPRERGICLQDGKKLPRGIEGERREEKERGWKTGKLGGGGERGGGGSS